MTPKYPREEFTTMAIAVDDAVAINAKLFRSYLDACQAYWPHVNDVLHAEGKSQHGCILTDGGDQTLWLLPDGSLAERIAHKPGTPATVHALSDVEAAARFNVVDCIDRLGEKLRRDGEQARLLTEALRKRLSPLN
jgi:hypothetical protein